MKRIAILALVSLLMVGLIPMRAEAPNYGSPTWNIVWDGRAVYPDDDSPAWTETTVANTSRSFVYHNQIMNTTLLNATSEDKYAVSFTESDFVVAEARANMPLAGAVVELRFDGGTYDYAFIQAISTKVTVLYDDLPSQSTQSLEHYEASIVGSNHTYTLVSYIETGRTHIHAYYDHNLILAAQTEHTMSYTDFYFKCDVGASSPNYCEWDYVAVQTVDLTGKLEDLEKELEDVWAELSELRKRDGDTTKTANLPFVPVGTRGPILEQEWYELDPYMSYSYTAYDNDTGNDMNFYRVWNSDVTDYLSISDQWFIAGSYSKLYVNDTKNTTATGDDTAIPGFGGTTETRTYHYSEYAFNISVETDAASSIKFNRESRVQVFDEFTWGENSATGLFGTQQTIENDCDMDWRYVAVYFAFPETDSDGVTVIPDMSSIVVTDDDNNLELDRGEHWTTDAGGVYLAFMYLNSTDSRTFSIDFNRELVDMDEIMSLIVDGDVEFTEVMRTHPYEFSVWHGVLATRQFYGKWIVKYEFSREYHGKRPGRAFVYVNDIRTDKFVLYSDRLEVYDVMLDAGTSNELRVLFDWRSAETEATNWFAVNVVGVICVGLIAFFVGVKWLYENLEKKGTSMQKFLGFVMVIGGWVLIGFVVYLAIP